MYVRFKNGLIGVVDKLEEGMIEINERDLANQLIDATLQGDNSPIVNQFISVNEAARLLNKYLGSFNIPPPAGGCCG